MFTSKPKRFDGRRSFFLSFLCVLFLVGCESASPPPHATSKPPTSLVTEFAVPTVNSQPGGITSGPDGALWFTETDRIGRISVLDQITQFPLSTATTSSPFGITSGPDGALWFAEFGTTSQIGRISVQGQITQFPLPATDTPTEITSGPDGALWFTESGTNKIGRLRLRKPS